MDTCTACKAMHEVLEALRRDHPSQLNVTEINIIEQPDAVRDWRVLAIPTQVLLDAEGREIDRHIGFLSARMIRARFIAQGVKLDDSAGSP